MWWGVCLSNAAGRQFAPTSLSGKTCLCVKCVFRLCNIARWSVRLNSDTPSSFAWSLERMQPKHSRCFKRPSRTTAFQGAREGWHQRHGQAPPWQCPQPHGLHRNQLPGPEQHPGGPPAPLQSRLSTVRLFFVSPTEERAERKALGVRGKHPKACYNVPKRHSRRGVSGCLPGVAITSPQVYWCRGRVFWRILSICTSTINKSIFLRKCALLL